MLRSMSDLRRLPTIFLFAFVGCTQTEPQGPAVYVDNPAAIDPVKTLSISMVDVGQGDGLVLVTPSGTVIALDGGPDRTGNYASFLAQKNITRVDYVILSHAHSDHYTGLGTPIAMLPKDCTPRVFDPGFDRPEVSGYTYIRSVAGCRYATLTQNQTLALDPAVELQVMGVAKAPFPENDSTGINNTSAVIRLRYGAFSMLFTGDAETEAEKNIHAQFGNSLQANVLKVGHHGSCNSTASTFLRAVAPSYALISAGNQNDFGHPHCQVVGKLRNAGVHFYRTDTNGNVTVTTDGKVFSVAAQKSAVDLGTCPRNCAFPTDF